MQKKLLMEYALLESQYRALEQKRDALRENIVKMFHKEGVDKLEDPTLGMFTIGRRTSWTYTKAVQKIEEKLKIAKKTEQQKGLAKASDTEYLLYKEPKVEA